MTIFKVARIVAKVIFILCIIGAAGCIVALFALPLVGLALPSVFFEESALYLPTAYLDCVSGLFSCAAEAVLAFLAERYFAKALKAGTPFTFEGAKECLRLGIIYLIASVALSVILGIVAGISLIVSTGELSSFDVSVSLSTGLFFIFMSLIFKHGAEIHSAYAYTPKCEAPAQETPCAEQPKEEAPAQEAPAQEAKKEEPTTETEAL